MTRLIETAVALRLMNSLLVTGMAFSLLVQLEFRQTHYQVDKAAHFFINSRVVAPKGCGRAPVSFFKIFQKGSLGIWIDL
jgi:hypothetical protein